MMSDYKKLIEGLNDPDKKTRLDSLRMLKELIDNSTIEASENKGYVNNHIHTSFSFSPYSPTKALWMAYRSGLATAGIMDHDSISGALEFIEAGRIMDMPTTIGLECRVDFSDTPLEGRRINNPDQKSIAYMALHGIAHSQIDRVKDFFKPYSLERNKRNMLMVDRINDLFKAHGISLSFQDEVIPISNFNEGGSITERHLLFKLSKKLVEKFGRGKELINFLSHEMAITIRPTQLEQLEDKDNEFYEYDLLGLLKSDLTEKIYIDASYECPPVRDIIAFSKEISAISAYPYLGDVGDSVTGDKRTQKFEDDYLDELFKVLKGLDFDAITYMPTRNSKKQLIRLKELCKEYDFFEISGEDINSPRQSFICPALEDTLFHNLFDSTWALIGHERIASLDLDRAMFSKRTKLDYPKLEDRIDLYKKLGKMTDEGIEEWLSGSHN